jgi:protein SCO1/2
MRAALAAMVLLLALPLGAQAGLSRVALDTVGVHLPSNAGLDMDISAPDTAGTVRSLRDIAGGRPVFFNFIDYTCNALCGTDLMLLANGLERAGLRPDQFRIIVLGIDPKDGAAAARRMEDKEIPPSLRSVTTFLLPGKAAIAKATAALGFHYVYDPQVDQFAHPAVVYALGPDGTVRAVLSPLALAAGDLRQALNGPEPLSLYERIHALCYSYDPATGVYTPRISFLLKVGGLATTLALAAGIAFLSRRERRA